ncbi:trypsin [Nesidiocoris tenuis]|uniref:Trypsin n=1 Tax=Nesidiocoris tenuis TaxID=355587 RepID=A0ABN7B1Q3_9HEMI|nr:trypsin [Nesidiocoris tenuis]
MKSCAPHTLFLWIAFWFDSTLKLSLTLNHGRDARLGEFPYVMRIIISEDNVDIKQDQVVLEKYVEQSGRIATGVLITNWRILTTCDSVGYFTGQRVHLHNLTRVLISGGSVQKRKGIFRSPTNSSVHPHCYSLISGIVLFNYGLYELEKKHSFPNSSNLKPLGNSYISRNAMAAALKRLYSTQPNDVVCKTAGWGYPRKEFEGKGMPDHFEASSDTLQATDIKVVGYSYCSERTCKDLDECIMSIWEYGFVCAEASQGGPCMNDKGAPLICAGQLFAIHTNPFKCEDRGIPRHFIRIDLAFEYIYGITDGASYMGRSVSLMGLLIFHLRWL